VNIHFYIEDIPDFDLPEETIRKSLHRLIEEEKKKTGEIAVIFCSDRYLLRINQEYLKREDYTDIITFDYSEADTLSGDLFISLERIRENAEKYREEFERELYRVLFHGVLHLVGYNDKSPNEIKEMRRKEEHYLMKRFKK